MALGLPTNTNLGTWSTLNMLGLTGTLGNSSKAPSVKMSAGIAMAKVANNAMTYPLKAMTQSFTSALPTSKNYSYSYQTSSTYNYLA